jgi:hypothetical protein
MQYASGVPAQIITPALSDKYITSNTFTATFADDEIVNCIGIGYTDATEIEISDGSDTVTVTIPATNKNGLYLLDTTFVSSVYTITHNGNYIGRVGIGEYRTLGTSPSKELGFYTTNESRTTLSGQVISGAGGYCGRSIDLDVRYKIDEDVYNDIAEAYCSQISKEYPYFILLDDEQHKVPASMLHFYANTDKPISKLQSSTYKFLYSYKFQFRECF